MAKSKTRAAMADPETLPIFTDEQLAKAGKAKWGGLRYPKGGRPKSEVKTGVLSVRIPEDLLERLRGMANTKDEEGKTITLSQVVVSLLRKGLEA